MIAAQIILGLQALVSRATNPTESLVISMTKLAAGQNYSISPENAEIGGTVRTLVPALRDFAERHILASAQGIAQAFGADVEFQYRRHIPVTINQIQETKIAIRTASKLVGSASVDEKVGAAMGAEHFAFVAEARPGAYMLLSNGPSRATRHMTSTIRPCPYGIGYGGELGRDGTVRMGPQY